ncbi:MAG: hypothetical protein IJ557_02340 [Bacteroidaceae bacterium]|nr:hypothetical protein [Bacteroidaceae bacterium]
MNDRQQYRLMRKVIFAALETIGTFFAILMCFALIGTCASCKQVEYVEVERHTTDSIYIKQVQHDSIHVHDSIWAERRGDTIFVDRWHTKYVERIKNDTINVSHADTVPVPYPVEVVKEVEKPLNWWQKTAMWIGSFVCAAVVILMVAWVCQRIMHYYNR